MISRKEPVIRLRERSGYDLPSMERLLEHCKKNVAVFQDAIAKEEEKMAEYARIISVLKEKAAAAALSIAVPKQS